MVRFNFNNSLSLITKILGFFFITMGLATLIFVGKYCIFSCPDCGSQSLYNCSMVMLFVGIIFLEVGFVIVKKYPSYIS